MVFTVNSSAGAFAALQNLQKSGRGLKLSSMAADSGKKQETEQPVSVDEGAKKESADAGGLGAVRESLARARAATQVAFVAADKVGTLIDGLRQKAEAAQDETLADEDRAALDEAFVRERDEIEKVIADADYEGFNAVKAGGTPILAVATEKGDRVIDVPAQDLSLGGANVTLDRNQGIATPEEAAAAAEALAASADRVDAAAGTFEQGGARLDAQMQFVDKLAGTIEEGIGNLVDVGLEREAASLQALDVKQQLGIQDLSIANQSPGAILSLFR